ncbi:MAG: GHMP kinase [Calditrichales bacterium]|nr:MAG: GHMP kinase [Calditrichales bacterium]
MIIETRAYARAGLLGNPSDGYFGKTISVIVKNFGAHISLYQTPELRIEPQSQDKLEFKNINELVDSIRLNGYYGGTRLVRATIKKFWEYCQMQNIRLESKNFTVRYHSNIPRQVGLAGSSAIITATMRALMTFYKVKISKEMLPSVILSVENEELGINAGLQDRVIQVYEGCVFMDFDKELIQKENHGRYVALDPANLPKLFIAYRVDMSKISGTVLNDVRIRYEKGDEKVIEALKQIADCAEQGKTAIQNKDHQTLHTLMNRNFDLRCQIMNIRDEDRELVEKARECGASAKFAGSGGSIIGMYTDDVMLNRLKVDLKKLKARVITPYIL